MHHFQREADLTRVYHRGRTLSLEHYDFEVHSLLNEQLSVEELTELLDYCCFHETSPFTEAELQVLRQLVNEVPVTPELAAEFLSCVDYLLTIFE